MNSRSEYSFDKNSIDRFQSLLKYASETRSDYQIVSEDGENRADVHSFMVFPVSPFFRRQCSTLNPYVAPCSGVMLGHILNLIYFQKTSAALSIAEVNELRKLLDKFEIDSNIIPITSVPRSTNMSNRFGLGTISPPNNDSDMPKLTSPPAEHTANQKPNKKDSQIFEVPLLSEQTLEIQQMGSVSDTAYGLRTKPIKSAAAKTRKANNKITEVKTMIEIQAKRLKPAVDDDIKNFNFSGSHLDGFSGSNSGFDLIKPQGRLKIAENVVGKF